MDIEVDADLLASVERAEIDQWQAMSIQTCRDAAYAREQVDDLKKKLDELTSLPEDLPEESNQAPKVNPIRLVPRDG